MNPRAKTFEFTSCKLDPKKRTAFFGYKILFANRKPLEFVETLVFPKSFTIQKEKHVLIQEVLKAAHIMLGISYYKLYCPKKIITSSSLSKEQAEFFNVVYRKGLGEFFFRNKLDPKSAIKFPYAKKIKVHSYEIRKGEKILLGIGGGKDSIVAGELLKEHENNATALLIETQITSAISAVVVAEMGIKSLVVKRYLDEKIFQNHEGAHNGHVPISAVFAFIGYLTAVLYDYSYVAVGNEYSSNFGNIIYKGETINHQWSKSAEFETLFQKYTQSFFSPNITYFSLLRPFHEIRIAQMFSQHKNYFPLFTSCNRSFRVHKKRAAELWCGECAKCVFVFTLLSAFLSKKELLGIFKKNLFEDEKLVSMFADVLGFGTMKPFDCVGTFEEARAALFLARSKFAGSLIHKKFLSKIKNGKQLVSTVMKAYPAPTLPDRFLFYGMKSALILGYGQEGKATHAYLKKNFPNLKIGIADQKNGADYLSQQEKYDLAIKTPGIPKNLVTIPHTTATNIFFSQISQNKIIGVTGTKGKSTTASLIHALLKEAGKNVTLLGNIGKPMLETLLRPIKKDEIFVLELSSYQLGDIKYSPHVAVTLNLFPEHMNYHGGAEKYYEAKKNIVAFQNNNDYFVYNKKDKKLAAWAKSAKAKPIPFANARGGIFKSNLLGKHNEDNIAAAVTVAKLFHVSDGATRRALKKFKPLPHRLECVGTFKGITFYDDAISTTPESTSMAIKTLKNIGTIFLGGEDRGYDFGKLEKEIRKSGIKNIVLFPDSGKKIVTSRKGLNVLETSDMHKAVAFAYEHAPKGSICLLSTASPSYSVWKNFEEKGDLFKKYVKMLKR